MSPLQTAVWEFLKELFAGMETAQPRTVVLTRFNMLRAWDLSDRDFRDTVAQLVTVFKSRSAQRRRWATSWHALRRKKIKRSTTSTQPF
jgi:hypothetical protein